MANLRALVLEQRSLRQVALPVGPRSSPAASRSYADTSAVASSSSSTASTKSLESPMSRGRQLLSPLRKARRDARLKRVHNYDLTSAQDANPLAMEAASSPGLVQTPASKRNAPLEALLGLLAEPRATTTSAQNMREVLHAKRIWQAYLRIVEHADITPETWTAILEAVVPIAKVAADYKPKTWRPRKLTEYFEQGFDDRLERILRDKTSVGLFPDEDDYLFVMHHLAIAGSVRRTEEVFQEMVDKGIEPSKRAYKVRLQAIRIWLRRYTSSEAKRRIAQGSLPPWREAIGPIPDLVASIMVKVQEGGYESVIPDGMVDEACLIYARLGDWDRFNSLARWGYGVDLDVPDAIPQEYLDRVRDEDAGLSRGLRKAGLAALLHLCMTAGQPWRALSSLEIFAYDTATPPHLHPSLSRRTLDSTAPTDVAPEDDYLRYAPPLPPSAAIAMMNVRPVIITPPADYSPTASTSDCSSSPDAASATDPTDAVPEPTGVMYELRDAPHKFPPAAIKLDHVTYTILLEGIRGQDLSLTPASSLVALYKHVLTRALASFYDERQRVMGTLLRLLSRPIEASEDRGRDLQTLKPLGMRVRPHWFSGLLPLVEGEDARTRFEVLGWAEEEERHWRLAIEMDHWIMQKAINVLSADRKKVVEQMRTPAGHPVFEREDDSRLLATHTNNINLMSELKESHFHRDTSTPPFRKLAEARVRAAWADLHNMHVLLSQGHAPSHEFEDGTTVASRVDQYTALLTERVSWELEPSRATTGDTDLLSVKARFAALGLLIEKDAFGPGQLKGNNRYLQFPTAEVPNLLELSTLKYNPPMHPSLNS